MRERGFAVCFVDVVVLMMEEGGGGREGSQQGGWMGNNISVWWLAVCLCT